MTAKELCHLLNGELEGDPDVAVNKPSKIEEAEAGSMSFLANPKYEQFVYDTKASVLLVNKSFVPRHPISPTLIRVDDVYASLSVLLDAVNGEMQMEEGVSDLAFIHANARVGDDVTIGPFVYVGADAVIEKGAKIYPQVFVGDGVHIGRDVKIFAGVKLYHRTEVGDRSIIHSNSVIGSDGFGFAKGANGEFSKISQVGNVVIEEDVEIGANTVIDRATMGSTIIRKGAKLDNLIQIAHNVEIGSDTAIAAQAGIAGSTKIGKQVLVGGQAGFVGHIEIADGVQIQAQSGIASSVKEPGKRLYGSPALEYMDYLKSYAVFRRLPDLQKRVSELENIISKLENRQNGHPGEDDS